MRIIPAMSKMLAITLTAGFVLAGCTTERPADYRPGPGYSEPVSPALREHRRRQRIRAEEGHYRRLYRQKDCRYASRNCDGYGHFRP